MMKQSYCQTGWGRVCYWSVERFLPENEVASSSVDTTMIVFLHGVGSSGRYWISHLEWLELHSLEEEHSGRILALAPGLLGFGASDKPHRFFRRILTPAWQYSNSMTSTRHCSSIAMLIAMFHGSMA